MSDIPPPLRYRVADKVCAAIAGAYFALALLTALILHFG